MNFSVIISHPHRQQNIYERPLAAYRAGIPVKFLTGLYYRPEQIPYSLVKFLPASPRARVRYELDKRRVPNLDSDVVVSLFGPWLEMGFRPFGALDRWYQIHDWLAARWIQNHATTPAPTVLHCFDAACARTIKAANRKGIETVLEITYPPSTSVLVADEYRRLGLPVEKEHPPADLLVAMREAHYVVGQSKFSVASFLEFGVEPRRIIHLPLGVDIDQFHPAAANSAPRPFRVLFVGQLDIRKGLHHLLEVWTQLNLPAAELVLAGLPINKQGNELLEKFKGAYHWRGFVQHALLPTLYNESDIFVFPSMGEGGANVVYEALASGLPCVVTTNAGSAVRDGLEGYVIKVGDVAALKDRIYRLYSDPNLRRRMSLAARPRAEAYSWNQFGRRLVLMYEAIVNGTQESARDILDLSEQ